MTFPFQKGRYGVRIANSSTDVLACQRLRHRCFYGAAGQDADQYDAHCTHVMVADGNGLVATCRVATVQPDFVGSSYSGRRYDLSAFEGLTGPFVEIGRFCIAPDVVDVDIVRLVWGAVTQIVDQSGATLLLGCVSFAGTDHNLYSAGFDLLASRFQGPFVVGRKSAEIVPFNRGQASHNQGLAQLPPLLRSYLSMGGWVSDHAVIDRNMNTIHVFCGVEVAKIPTARVKSLRKLAS